VGAGRGVGARAARRADRARRARIRPHADPGAPAHRGGDGGRVAGRAVGRALPARARRVGPAGVRGLAPEKNFYVELAARAGHGASARECQQLFLEGSRDSAAAALSVELIDAMAIATTPAGLDDRLAAFAGAGADTVVVVPCGDRVPLVRTLAEAMRGAHA
jgi:hypothetical protein